MWPRCTRASVRRWRAPAPHRASTPARAPRSGTRSEMKRSGSGPSRPTAPCAFDPGCAAAVKAVLRKLMRWYVEPLAYDQRSFNAAVLRLVDDLDMRIAQLEAELKSRQ